MTAHNTIRFEGIWGYPSCKAKFDAAPPSPQSPERHWSRRRYVPMAIALRCQSPVRIGGRGGISSSVITSAGWTNFCVYFCAMDYGRTFLVGHTSTHLAMQKDAHRIAGSALLLVPYRLWFARHWHAKKLPISESVQSWVSFREFQRSVSSWRSFSKNLSEL